MNWKLVICLAVSCVLALGVTANANRITHNGVEVFSDDFEGQTVGFEPDSFSMSGPGTWAIDGSPNDIAKVTDAADPGAAQGSNYLHMQRGDGKYSARLIDEVNSGVVHVDMMVNQTEPGAMFNAGTAGGSTEGQVDGKQIFGLDARDSSHGNKFHITKGNYNNSAGYLQAAGGGDMSYVENKWQRYQFTIDLDNDTFSLNLDGVQSVSVPLNNTFDVNGATEKSMNQFGVRMSGSDGAGSTVYMDASIPEPSTVALLVISIVGLVGFSRRTK